MRSLTTLDRSLVDALYAVVGVPRVRFCPLMLTARQEAFLQLSAKEVFFGGAAGGGKTVSLLAGGLQYADVAGYHALILRRSLTELALPGNLIDLSHQWLATSPAIWNNDLKQWRFPGPSRSGAGGATLTFGYLNDDSDIHRYSGSSFSYLAFDELTRFPETHYRRMFRVLRQPTGLTDGVPARDGTQLSDVPIRIRSASNPGGEYHEWVKTRFVDPSTRNEEVVFLRSRLEDNPHLDRAEYEGMLVELPPAERERLRYGNWDIPDDGSLFKRDWFPVIDEREVPAIKRAVRYWDLAGTEPGPGNPDPDYTVGLLLGLDSDDIFYVLNVVRVRRAPGAVERIVSETAKSDGRGVEVMLEEEGGASGKIVTDRYKRQVLRGHTVRSDRPSGPKDVRAHPVAAAAENGYLRVVRRSQIVAFLDELSSFPHGRHDDCIDALAGAYNYLARKGRQPRRARTSLPQGRIPGVYSYPHGYYNFQT